MSIAPCWVSGACREGRQCAASFRAGRAPQQAVRDGGGPCRGSAAGRDHPYRIILAMMKPDDQGGPSGGTRRPRQSGAAAAGRPAALQQTPTSLASRPQQAR